MIFTVTWLPSAVNELARLWLKALNRQALTDAGDRIDQVLRHNPQDQGQKLRTHRLLIIPPLAASFSVSVADRLVEVLQIELLSLDNGQGKTGYTK